MMNAKQLAARTNVVTSFVSKSWMTDGTRTVVQFLPREKQVIGMTQTREREIIASSVLPIKEDDWALLYKVFATNTSFERWEMSY